MKYFILLFLIPSTLISCPHCAEIEFFNSEQEIRREIPEGSVIIPIPKEMIPYYLQGLADGYYFARSILRLYLKTNEMID